jgi:hypothetical protein
VHSTLLTMVAAAWQALDELAAPVLAIGTK